MKYKSAQFKFVAEKYGVNYKFPFNALHLRLNMYYTYLCWVLSFHLLINLLFTMINFIDFHNITSIKFITNFPFRIYMNIFLTMSKIIKKIMFMQILKCK